MGALAHTCPAQARRGDSSAQTRLRRVPWMRPPLVQPWVRPPTSANPALVGRQPSLAYATGSGARGDNGNCDLSGRAGHAFDAPEKHAVRASDNDAAQTLQQSRAGDAAFAGSGGNTRSLGRRCHHDPLSKCCHGSQVTCFTTRAKPRSQWSKIWVGLTTHDAHVVGFMYYGRRPCKKADSEAAGVVAAMAR